MRIAYLCKRRYMSKDVILDRYARLYEMPLQLARLGHTFVLVAWTIAASAPEVSSSTAYRPALGLARPSFGSWHGRLSETRAPRVPRLRSGSSCCVRHPARGSAVAVTKAGGALCHDLHDNFEGFGQAASPAWSGPCGGPCARPTWC